jgi:hypothetical protein
MSLFCLAWGGNFCFIALDVDVNVDAIVKVCIGFWPLDLGVPFIPGVWNF